ncbi:hypothetical protein [Rahnella woolbedingensis]|uniref:Uncharacterized protein n=1 Tax=Rahnella woolbedingensis TaxID=1510574 RepID=A0A419N1P9_9GAMM|nr:hypothetical protein [Rahnella woolbedingensis]RJT30458.1 hypothetical protein D6C13_25160 [Rahnella woolbedingensis]
MTDLSKKELFAMLVKYRPESAEYRAALRLLEMKQSLVLLYAISDRSGSVFLDGEGCVAAEASALKQTVRALNEQFHTREFRVVPLCVAQNVKK